MKRPISRQMHGIADYIYAPVMFFAPKIAGFEEEDNASSICNIVASGVLVSTILTRAEWGLFRVLPFRAHLILDVAVSLSSLAAPWIFGFASNVRARNTFVAMGAVGAVVTVLTAPKEMPAV
jgi:hypothetical protein